KIRLNGIDVHQSAEAFTANGRRFPPGSWVIRMDQAFAALVKELFEVQSYPDLRDFPEGPPDLPYDVAGWTLPLQMGVDVTAVSKPLEEGFVSRLQRLDRVVPPPGSVQGRGTVFAFSHSSNSAVKAVNEILGAGGKVVVDQSIGAIRPGAKPEYGAFSASGLSRSEMEGIASRHSLQVQADSRQPSKSWTVRLPRVGLYRSWVASIDEGWTRWLLEDYGFNPESAYNADLQAGRLGDRFDVLLIADTRPQSILEGQAAGTIPAEFAGGIGAKGLENLIQFVQQGGTLITFNNASLFAIEQFNLPVENVLKDLKNEEFFCSGSLLKVEFPEDSDHPILTGMPSRPAVMFQRGPAFKAKADFQGRGALASYPKERNPLLSGYILNPEKIQGAAALMDVAFGKGRVILFGFRPQWRGQSHGTYMLIFNALHYFGESVQPGPAAEETARGVQLELWNELKDSIRKDFKGLIGANRASRQAGGTAAVEERKRLDALIERFQKERLEELEELREALQPPAREKMTEYISRLKNLLVDIRGKDLTGVDYTPQDLATHYSLQPLEKEITTALGAAQK
ncbi:MAG: hypothetical protein V3T83_05935, partial [Acidobacteriota bacterium]